MSEDVWVRLPAPARDYAGSDLHRTEPGSSPHASATAATQNNPPETSAAAGIITVVTA